MLLDRARTAGFFSSSAQVDRLKKDVDFAALEKRADYQQMLGKLP
jgi:hypothetical protein